MDSKRNKTHICRIREYGIVTSPQYMYFYNIVGQISNVMDSIFLAIHFILQSLGRILGCKCVILKLFDRNFRGVLKSIGKRL